MKTLITLFAFLSASVAHAALSPAVDANLVSCYYDNGLYTNEADGAFSAKLPAQFKILVADPSQQTPGFFGPGAVRHIVVDLEGGTFFGPDLQGLYQACRATVGQGRAFHSKVVIDLESGVVSLR